MDFRIRYRFNNIFCYNCSSYCYVNMTILAFMLVVIVNNNTLENEGCYFRDIYRCNQFAHAIEHGNVTFKDRRPRQHNISAYCLPVMLPTTTKFWD